MKIFNSFPKPTNTKWEVKNLGFSACDKIRIFVRICTKAVVVKPTICNQTVRATAQLNLIEIESLGNEKHEITQRCNSNELIFSIFSMEYHRSDSAFNSHLNQ